MCQNKIYTGFLNSNKIKQAMKVLVFADMHGSETGFKKIEIKAKRAGIILCAGDFTIFGQKQNQILKQINDLGKLCLLIHGNHETPGEVEEQCKKYKNILFMHKKVIRIGHLIFVGYGGDGFSLRDRNFETTFAPRFAVGIKKYKEKIEKESLKKAKTVLMVHGPPYGSKVDAIGDQHCGNKSYREFYLKNKIDYVFSGHIHESAGTVEHIKNTTLMNPGPFGVLLEM